MTDPNNLSEDSEATRLASTQTAGSGAGPFTSIGPYRLLQKVGEGGMGEVWQAEQAEPMRRRVALKVIKQGMDTKQVIARFEAERQALALMDHPSVAKVLDAGSTAEGRPYFVMEYVAGVPIVEHCDRHKLTTHERLELFMQVCDGVQHAHHKAIIHRDLKPSNVLVSIQDGTAVPKIIDFGVAKATAQRLTEKTLFTEVGVLIGTPEYMSPEQADLTVQDVDTRTDVYSLGVMLYELLVGALPFEPKALREAGFDGIRRMIREVEPPKPSLRLSTLGEERSTDCAMHRRVDIPSLRRLLSGDLDWITMKALEKDRGRRYGSPSELAADIGRFLRHEPVEARPPRATYIMGKFARRHWIAVALASASALLLVGIMVRERIQAGRIARALAVAAAEAESAREVSGFLAGLFEVSDPGQARGKIITAREILDRGAKRIREKPLLDPVVRARLMSVAGRVYFNLGIYDEAEPLLDTALRIREESLGPEDVDVAESLRSLADLYSLQFKYDRAESLYERALLIQEARLGPRELETAKTLYSLGSLYSRRRETEEQAVKAKEMLSRALVIRESVIGPTDPQVAEVLHALGLYNLREGRNGEAAGLLERAVSITETALGSDHPDVARSLHVLALVRHGQGEQGESERLYRRTLRIRENALGTDNAYYGQTLVNYANLLVDLGRDAEARPLYERAVAIWESRFGENYPDLASPLAALASIHIQQGHSATARPILQRMLALQDLSGGPHDSTARTLLQIAACHQAVGERDMAADIHEKAIGILENLYGPNNPATAYAEACYRALIRDRDSAMRALKRATELGYDDGWVMRGHELLSLHGDPEFEAIKEQARQRAKD